MQLRLSLNSVGSILVLGLATAILGCQGAGPAPSASRVPASDHEPRPLVVEFAQGRDSPVDADRYGVLVMAHGGGESWNRAVETVVAPLRSSYPIEIAFGMARTSTLRSAAARLEQQGVDRIAVVRMFISGESFLDETEYILGLRHTLEGSHAHGHTGESTMAGSMQDDGEGDASPSAAGHAMEPPTPIESEATFMLSREGVGATAMVEEILVDRARSLSLSPPSECILILAHGPGDDGENERWLADMERRAARLREIGPFIDIRCETLREDWPHRRAEAEERIREYVRTHAAAGTRVIVLPFRVAGFGPYAEVLKGLEYVADGRGFCPHPNMTFWIDQTARACLPSLPSWDPDAHVAGGG